MKPVQRVVTFVSIFVVAMLIGIVIGYNSNDGTDSKQSDVQPSPMPSQTPFVIVVTATPLPQTPTPSFTPSPSATRTPFPDLGHLPTVSVSCNGSRTCSGMRSCEMAYACYYGGNRRLDGDGNFVPCQELCTGIEYAPFGYPAIIPPWLPTPISE